ncbi:MAG: DUF116 domain-containing protein [Bacteroidetes bacterium]|nr:DUF116 domain-containing protein [Bacteroidota bacterium]
MTFPFFRNTYSPVQGQTYSLFGDGITTYQYFNSIEKIIDELFREYTLESLVGECRELSQIPFLKRVLVKNKADNHLSNKITDLLFEKLAIYTPNAGNHLKKLSRLKLREQVVWTTEKQHHLYMLEIGILNRMNIQNFQDCEKKIAFLPYCLRDECLDCKAKKEDFDKVCKECTKSCLIGIISNFLKKQGVTAYIWSGKSLKPIFKRHHSKNETLGVLGIACIPELMNGMRMCDKAGFTVIGHPLNANRCAKWMGTWHQNNIDLVQLEEMLIKKQYKTN